MGLNIKKIKIDDIKPASYNPRKIDTKNFKKLSNSIKEFGLVDPIIINLKNHNIIGGHQRFDYLYYEKKDTELHLIELGDIGWVFSDTDLTIKDENHEKALNLALNRISGEWKFDELNNILDELAEVKLDEITGFDYDLDEIDYEYIPLEYEDDELEEELIDEVDETHLQEPVEEDVVELFEAEKEINTIPKNSIFKNLNNIIFYGEETEDNINRLLEEKQEIRKYNIKDLKLIKTIKTPINYYITDNEEVIRTLLEDSETYKL